MIQHMRGAEALPVTRLFRGVRFSLGLVHASPAIGRELGRVTGRDDMRTGSGDEVSVVLAMSMLEHGRPTPVPDRESALRKALGMQGDGAQLVVEMAGQGRTFGEVAPLLSALRGVPTTERWTRELYHQALDCMEGLAGEMMAAQQAQDV